MSQIDTRILALSQAPRGEAGERVLAELIFARQLSLHKNGLFESEILQALALLEDGLASLGQMYTNDDRFRSHIDAANDPGTAAFAAEAIRVFCR